MAKRGRRGKLTPALQAVIVKSLEGGNYFETACDAVGVSQAAAYNWLARGRAAAGIADLPQEQRYVEFLEAVTRASASAEAKAVQVLWDAMRKDWRAAEAFLKRRHSAHWRDDTRVELAGNVAVRTTHDFSKLSDEQLAAMDALLEQATVGAE